jgi:hypothetical protein
MEPGVEKDKSVTDFLGRLQLATDLTLVQFVDYWDADLCAIGIKRGNRLVYISTFDVVYKYYYELELLDENELGKYTVLQRGDGVDENVLISIVKEFLKI